jgi:hypothetical protein
MYLVIEQAKMEKPDRDMDFFIENPKKVMQKGITTPPPPMPAIVLRAMITGRIIKPENSEGKIGKMALCFHT